MELAGTYNLTPETFKEMLDERGLVAVSGHYQMDRLKNDPEGIAKEAKLFGMKFVGCPWIGHRGALDEEELMVAVDIFNHAGEVLAKEGIQFFYHPHGYEFVPQADGTGTLFDMFLEKTNADHVALEMDVMWILNPGQDPVKWLQALKGRWKLMHLKDLEKGHPIGPDAKVAGTTSQVVLACDS